MKKNKGFTVIELIVVIAIIAVLSTLVFIKIDNVRKKSKDAAIKQEMVKFYIPAMEYKQAQGDYGGMFTRNNQTDEIAARAAILAQSIYDRLPAYLDCKTCAYKSDGSSWAVCAVLNFPIDQSRAWCVDSNGAGVEICANQCKTNGLSSGFCPQINPPCTAPTGPHSCSGCAE